MAVEGGMSCVKYTLFAFNLLFVIFGIALFGLGIYVQVALHQYLDFFTTDINGPAILLIVVGLFTLAIAFFGCCGAIKENYCMMMTFAILIGIIFVMELAAGIAGFVLKGKLESFVKDEMKASMKNYGKQSAGGVTQTWDHTQTEFECCGASNYTNWNDVLNVTETRYPSSCCKNMDENCTRATLGFFETPCYSKIEDLLRNNVGYFAGAAVALGVIELVGIVIACLLARTIKSMDIIA